MIPVHHVAGRLLRRRADQSVWQFESPCDGRLLRIVGIADLADRTPRVLNADLHLMLDDGRAIKTPYNRQDGFWQWPVRQGTLLVAEFSCEVSAAQLRVQEGGVS